MYRKRRISIIVLLIVLVWALWSIQASPEFRIIRQDASIVLTPNGFEPARLTIQNGTTVTFSTTRGEPFWPASDQHPEHTEYPSFDPKEPIDPKETWTFTFDRIGQWRMHDHISPNYSAMVTVVSPDDAGQVFVDIMMSRVLGLLGDNVQVEYQKKACQKSFSTDQEMFDCWERVLVSVTQTLGVNQALNLLEELKNANLHLASDCHVLAHAIGEETYWRYRGASRFDITANTGLCNMGFYHGYMQEYASHNTSLEAAKEFCDHVKTEEQKTPFVANAGLYGNNCDHGIGHGLTYRYVVSHWGDDAAILEQATKDCYQMFGDDAYDCLNGAYGGVAAIYFGLHGYKIDIDMAEPFKLCDGRPETEMVLCYDSMIPPLYNVFLQDLPTLGRLVVGLPDKKAARVAMHHLGSMPTHRLVPQTDDYMPVVEDCRRFPSDFHLECIKGFGGGILYIGSFDDAAERTLAFCRNPNLDENERRACLEGYARTLHYSHPLETIERGCQLLTDEERYVCAQASL